MAIVSSLWYYNGELIELEGEDPYGYEWHHCSYAIFNEEKLGLPKGTVKYWCEDNGYRVMQLYNDDGDSWDKFFTFMFRKGYIRVFIARDRANIMYLSRNKRSINACIDMMDMYGEELKKMGVFTFVLAAIDNLGEPFISNNIMDCLTYLVNL